MEFCQVELEGHTHSMTIYISGFLADLAATRTEVMVGLWAKERAPFASTCAASRYRPNVVRPRRPFVEPLARRQARARRDSVSRTIHTLVSAGVFDACSLELQPTLIEPLRYIRHSARARRVAPLN